MAGWPLTYANCTSAGPCPACPPRRWLCPQHARTTAVLQAPWQASRGGRLRALSAVPAPFSGADACVFVPLHPL